MKTMRNVIKRREERKMKNSSIHKVTPKKWSCSEGISNLRALSPLILRKGRPMMRSA
jgi:hypothetical protein